MEFSFLEDPKISRFEEYLEPPKAKTLSWFISKYHIHFNIDSITVRNRIYKSIFPSKSLSFFGDSVPDLYGPIWISITLIMLTSYLKSLSGPVFHSFCMISLSIYLLLLFVPLASRFIVNHVSFVYMFSFFGYSLAGNLLAVALSGVFKNYWAFIVVNLGTLWTSGILVKNMIKEFDTEKKNFLA